MRILGILLRSARWIIACVGIQFLLFVALAAWKRLAPESDLAKKAIDAVFELYGPGLDLVHEALPEQWLSGGESVPPILALALVVVAYGIVLGLAVGMSGPLLRVVARRVLRRR